MKPLRMSSAERYYLCAGSAHAEDGLPEPVPEPEALEGTRTHQLIHMALEDKQLPEMSERQEKIVERFVAKVRTVESGKPQFTMTEEEVVIRDEDGTPVWIGHPDRVSDFGSYVHIFDYKTGWLEQPRASEHIQLRAYIVAAYDYLSLGLRNSDVYFGHILSGEKAELTTVRFELEDIQRARQELMKIAEYCANEKAKRVPGERQCKYCRARGTGKCPESQQELSLMPTHERLAMIPVEHLATIYQQWKNRVAPTGEALKKHIKQLWAEGIEIPGLHEGESKTRRSITDTQAAFQALSNDLGITGDEFSAKCNITMANVEDLVYEYFDGMEQKITKVKSRKVANDLLSGIIEYKETAKPIELDDEAEQDKQES